MAKANVVICDSCKKEVAVGKCNLCGRDICHSCEKVFPITLGKNTHIHLRYCPECYNKMVINIANNTNGYDTFWSEEFIDKITKEFVNYIKKGTLAKNLEKGSQKGEMTALFG
jgi:hypothetical protein